MSTGCYILVLKDIKDHLAFSIKASGIHLRASVVINIDEFDSKVSINNVIICWFKFCSHDCNFLSHLIVADLLK